MHILYYFWNENTATDIEETFANLHLTHRKIQIPFEDYESDTICIGKIKRVLQAENFDAIFSFNYFPFLSIIAESASIPYISWVYDCPHLTLYSRTISNSCNYLFLFDRIMCDEIKGIGAKHIHHLPLAVNSTRLEKITDAASAPSTFSHDISFVGSLYENNMFDQINYLPDELLGYLHGILNAQQKVWGYNFIGELLTEDKRLELEKYVLLPKDARYSYPSKTIFTNLLNQKITAMDRVELLTLLASHFSVDLFTGSNASLCPNCNGKGTISYETEMPIVFHASKININISLRSITSGIPLRCIDVLGAGGFLLSNYQPELVEFFTPDQDFVYFEDENDLLAKADYYLAHDTKRNAIAQNGHKKTLELFSYEKQFQKILSLIKEA